MLILARHGQTAHNAAGRLLGRLDLPLTDSGRQQAGELAYALGGVELVVSSPLARARETAAALGRPVTVDERWIEVDYGDYDGVAYRDVPEDAWRRWRDDLTWAPPGGESLEAVGRRVRAACEDLVALATEADVVVVSHVSPIKAAVAWALGAGDAIAWRMFLDVAAVCRINVGPRGPSLRTYNETAHLSGAG